LLLEGWRYAVAEEQRADVCALKSMAEAVGIEHSSRDIFSRRFVKEGLPYHHRDDGKVPNVYANNHVS
jgi:hypothetical protein